MLFFIFLFFINKVFWKVSYYMFWKYGMFNMVGFFGNFLSNDIFNVNYLGLIICILFNEIYFFLFEYYEIIYLNFLRIGFYKDFVFYGLMEGLIKIFVMLIMILNEEYRVRRMGMNLFFF